MVKLIIPKLEDLWFREDLLKDERTMFFNHNYGGTIEFSCDKWESWFNRWINVCDNKRFYRYVVNDKNEFVGEVAYHYDEKIKGYIVSVIIHAKYRGRGYGSDALDLLCESAKDNGVSILYDDIAIDNPSVKMFLNHGFIKAKQVENKIWFYKML
ncbi:MAG: GNAT family N-acetyltransferase [Erysipelotrichaceae bacterium]|nr:GNAT family N-acetyltransferase [Erysipelotrichaceae bacterium]